jgi:hypothetical protein
MLVDLSHWELNQVRIAIAERLSNFQTKAGGVYGNTDFLKELSEFSHRIAAAERTSYMENTVETRKKILKREEESFAPFDSWWSRNND